MLVFPVVSVAGGGCISLVACSLHLGKLRDSGGRSGSGVEMCCTAVGGGGDGGGGVAAVVEDTGVDFVVILGDSGNGCLGYDGLPVRVVHRCPIRRDI